MRQDQDPERGSDEGLDEPSAEAVTPADEDDGVLEQLVPQRVEAARVGASPERLADLEAKIARALRRSRSDATIRAYRSDWADFTTWCHGVGLDPLPATSATVAAYVAELADPPDDRAPLKVSTISRRLAAISEAHKVAGVPNAVLDPLVRGTMAGIRRTLGVARTQKKGISTGDIRAAVAGLGDRPIEVRDRLVLVLGFAGGFRRSELSSLDVDDLEDHPDGLLVHLRASKTDQEKKGRRVEIVYGTHHATCPVRAVRAWIDLADLAGGPLLRPVDRHGNISPRRLSGQGVAGIVQRHMGRLGHPVSDFAGHSLRRGMATTAARAGAAERTIMATTGHTATDTVRSYIEDAALFTDPASGYLDL